MAKLNENDPRVKRTRDLITNAFISIISKKGFDSITVKDITKAATINRATFYAHFNDKYDLLDTLIVEKFSELLKDRMQGELSLNEMTINSLIFCLCDYFNIIKTTCECGFISILPLIGNKITEKLYSIIYSILQNEPYLVDNKAENLELLATMISTSIYNSVYRREMSKLSITKESLSKTIVSFIFDGINSQNK